MRGPRSIKLSRRTRRRCAVTPNGFWGFEDGDDVDDCRICRGKGDESESATAAMLTRRIKGVGQKRMFVNGDRVGLLVDMEAHTMRVFINDTLVPDLVFDGLPSPLSVAATPYNDDVTLTIKCISPGDWPTAVVTAAEAEGAAAAPAAAPAAVAPAAAPPPPPPPPPPHSSTIPPTAGGAGRRS